ncbi:3-oxoacyl-ACP synthase [Streptomyces piniterrae]|uniref:3-oxoacyl-ACP synthase n=1 Tax=Streptomyces piniterrae TaxID=2571125 RepID=A0A4U0MT36_9ACTN|nr:3-oxoacyl-[acyl-carrier-protein] synthase III C-terminal domain-containing protein [Streptomyces piniterrae]TJZ44127.1 3-oxoacyl-ACP synthase [Streptomyces piniterrae]
MNFGLMSFGTALGERAPVAEIASSYTRDVERVLEYGYRNIHRCPPDTGISDLAHEAALRALAEAGVEADELDLVVLAITDLPEYLYWDPSAHLQHRLGARRAETVLITQGCVGGITCLDEIAGRFATHPDYRRALVVGANRTIEAYWNRMETHSLLFSDGATAAVVGRDHERRRWRASEAVTDGRYAGFFLLEKGGSAAPFGAGGTASDEEPVAVRDGWDIMEYFDYDTDAFSAFVEMMNQRVADVVAEACRRVGVETTDLARVVLLNDNARTMNEVAKKLGVPAERTNLQVSMEYGHFGAADHLFNLDRLHRSGGIRPGELVALAGMGRGMHWACSIIEW